MKKIFVYLFLIFSCSFIYSLVCVSQELNKIKITKEQKEILGLKTKIIELSEIQPSVEVNGKIEELPQLKFEVNSPLPAKVFSINVQLGATVKKGQVLAILNSQEATQVAATGLTDQSIYRSQLSQAQTNLDFEQKKYEREKALFEHKINAKKDLEAAESSLKQAQDSVKAARQNLQIAVSSTQTRLNQIGSSYGGQITLRAPQDGQISKLNLTVGQTVDSGQILFEGINLSQVWASGSVFEKDINKIKLGQKVKVTDGEFCDHACEKAHEGQIIFISPVIDESQRSFPVKALLQNLSFHLKSGQFVNILIETTGKTRKAILLDKNSLIERNNKYYVYTVKNEYLIPVEVRVSEYKYEDSIEIESGLNAGEEVITEGAYLLPAKGEKIEMGHDHGGHEDESNEKEHETGHKEEHENKDNIIPVLLWIIGGGVLVASAFFAGTKVKK